MRFIFTKQHNTKSNRRRNSYNEAGVKLSPSETDVRMHESYVGKS